MYLYILSTMHSYINLRVGSCPTASEIVQQYLFSYNSIGKLGRIYIYICTCIYIYNKQWSAAVLVGYRYFRHQFINSEEVLCSPS